MGLYTGCAQGTFGFCSMAAIREDTKTQELNFIFKSLGEQGKKGEDLKEYIQDVTFFVLQQISDSLHKTSENSVMLRLYGSAAEDLMCLEPDDVGDLDIVIFPNSDNLLICDEIIEYLLDHPLHVRIKGGDHPVLQSCLVEDTGYVATSALKDFHPLIYGSSLHRFGEYQVHTAQLLSRKESSPLFPATYHLKNITNSPAVTVDIAQSCDTTLENMEMLKDPQNLVNLDPTSWEWFAHCLYTARERDFARAYTEVANDIYNLAKDLEMSWNERGAEVAPQMFAALFEKICWTDKIKSRLGDIQSLPTSENELTTMENCSAEETVHKNDQQSVESVAPKNERKKEHFSKELKLSFKDGSSVTPQNVNGNKTCAGELEAILSQSTTRDRRGNPEQVLSQKGISSQVTEISKDNVRCGVQQRGEASKKQHESEAQEQQSTKNKGRNPKDTSYNHCKEDKTDGKKRGVTCNCCFDHPSGEVTETKRNPSKRSKCNDTEKSHFQSQVTSGIDYVPAFRSRGWPKVAGEWINRERKWPSPDIVDRVTQEGFHLVVKCPKQGGNPDCDFRISFSHAEYLLSQEMNHIQRECYRCLKRYHRAYLSTEPKSLVSFHLKNIFLQTIEETGVEMWIENNRVECIMKLLANLLKVLRGRHLPHYFVRSYNLFCTDYVENPEILQTLAGKVKQIIENPMHFAKVLIQDQDVEDTRRVEKEETVPGIKLTHSAEPAKPEEKYLHGQLKETLFKGYDKQREKTEAIHPGNSAITSYRYKELKDIFLASSKELTDIAFEEAQSNRPIETLDAVEMSLVEDLREIGRTYHVTAEVFPKMFDSAWDLVYCKVWFSNESNVRRRVLLGIRGVVETFKYALKHDAFAPGNQAAVMIRMLDPTVENPFDLSHIMPVGAGKELIRRAYYKLESRPAEPPKVDIEDIPLD